MLTLAPRRLPFREEKKRLVHSVLKNTTSDRALAPLVASLRSAHY
jgi:hypothetical protein